MNIYEYIKIQIKSLINTTKKKSNKQTKTHFKKS